MDEKHFGLSARPFRGTPDLEAYYPATGHEAALARLLQALAEDEGLALLTGVPGTGKTLLAHCLLDRLGPDFTCAFLTHSHFRDRASLLQAMLYDLSLPYEGKGEQELRLALTDFVLKNYADGRRTLVLVDEAQHLAPDLLEELRLLSNLESRQGKALQVVLVAQPELLETIKRAELAVFAQRLAVRATVEPLGLHEATDYLVQQLRRVGGNPESLIADEALTLLARATKGVPRLLNRAAHQAFTFAEAAGATQVDAEAALEALTFLELEVPETPADEEEVLSLDGDALSDESEPGRLRRMFSQTRRPA